jgi:hypothetical protein
MRLESKREFRDAWLAGRLGNRLRSWRTYEELLASGYLGCVSFRLHTPNSKHTQYHVPLAEIPARLEGLRDRGVDLRDVWFGESAPDGQLLLQGEYFDGQNGDALYDRYLMYSRAKTQMKTALALPLAIDLYIARSGSWSHEAHCQFRHESEGLRTELLLQSVMNANSYDDFVELRQLYPTSVIEFSCYEHCLGDCDSRNTIIWEVRDY